MHLLVPGAYRPDGRGPAMNNSSCLNAPSGAGCLPTAHVAVRRFPLRWSQCTFWCRVLTDLRSGSLQIGRGWVSMHLLVPGAYRPSPPTDRTHRPGLNAPSGAGCLPTGRLPTSNMQATSLNAPSGAGCLPTKRPSVWGRTKPKSQCTFWCRVLTDCRLCKPRRSTVYSTVTATGDSRTPTRQ